MTAENCKFVSSPLLFNVPLNQQYPADVYKYIKLNASLKFAAKLMQVCKYFQQEKFPYFVAEEVFDDVQNIIYKPPRSNTYQSMKLSDLNEKLLWVTKELFFTRSPAALYIPKIAVFNIKQLWLEKQNIAFDEFKILTSAGMVKKFFASDSHIRVDGINEISFKDLLQCLPNVVEIIMYHYIPHFDTINFSQNSISPSFSKIALKEVQNCLNFDNLFEFIKMHPKIKYDIRIEPLLSLECIQSLQAFVDEIIEANSTEYPTPWIHFKGQTTESYQALSKIYANFRKKRKELFKFRV